MNSKILSDLDISADLVCKTHAKRFLNSLTKKKTVKEQSTAKQKKQQQIRKKRKIRKKI